MSVNNYGNANVVALLPVYGGNILANNVTGTLTTPVQPNISVVGTLTYVSTTGNIDGLGNIRVVKDITTTLGNIYVHSGTITAVGNIVTSGNLVAGTNVVAVNNLVGNGAFINGNIATTGILTDNYYYANGAPINLGGSSNYSNANVAAYLPVNTADLRAGNAWIEGNLSVQGNVIFTDSNVIVTNQKIVELANNASTTSSANGAGLQVGPFNAPFANIFWDQPNDSWDIRNNIRTPGNIFTGGNVQVQANLSVIGNVTVASNVTVDNSVLANMYYGNGYYLTGLQTGSTNKIFNGNTSVEIPAADANVVITVSLTGNVAQFTPVGLDVNGNITTSGVYGNISGANYITANVFNGNTVSVGNATITGNVSTGNLNVSNAGVRLADTASTAGQANSSGIIVGAAPTSFASLLYNSTSNTWDSSISLSVTGNIIAGGNISAAGNISLANLTADNITTNSLTANVANIVSLVGNTISITGNSSSNNISSNNSSITSMFGSVISITGNITAGNISTAGNVNSSNINATTSRITSILGTTVSVTGNILSGNISSTGNILTTGNISTTGNITGNVFIGNGSQLTNITATSLVNGNSNIVVQANGSTTFGSIGISNVLAISSSNIYTNSSNLVVGANSVAANISINSTIFTSPLSVTDAGAGFVSQTLLRRYSASTPSIITLAVNSSETIGTNSDVVNSQVLGRIQGAGFVLADYKKFANIDLSVDDTGTLSGTSSPGKIVFSTSPDGSIIPVARLTINSTGNAAFSSNVSVANLVAVGPNTSANFTRFPNTALVVSNVAAGIQQNEAGRSGIVAEAVADSTNTALRGVGLYGVGYTAGAASADGVSGEAHVSISGDTGTATAVRGYAEAVHNGGINIGLFSSAINGLTNYALYMKHGNIFSNDPQGWTTVPNTANSWQIGSNIKPNILNVDTTTGTERITVNGNLSVVGNVNGTYFFGNGSQLTGISTGSSTISNGSSNVNIDSANANVTISVSTIGNVVVVSPTGVSVAGTLQSSGNIGAGNISITGNVFSGNVSATGVVNATVGVTTGTLQVKDIISTGNVSLTGVISSTGTITSGSNIQAQGVISATGGLGTAGTISAVGNISGGNISVVGRILGDFVGVPGASLQLGSLGLSNNISATGTLYVGSSASVVGTLTTPTANVDTINITGVSSITGTSITGTQTTTFATANANIILTGDTLGGSGNIALNAGGNNVVLVGNTGASITGNLSVSGVFSPGNITTGNISAGNISASGNIYGGNLSVSGNVNATYVNSALVYATTISSQGGIFANSVISTFGTVAGLNVFTGGITATGNVRVGGFMSTVGNIIGNSSIYSYGTTTSGFGAVYTGPTGYTTLPSTTIQITANANTYAQLNAQNLSTGTDAATEFVATADNGSDTTYFVDLGIVNSTYDNASPNNSLGNSVYPRDSYLYAQGDSGSTGSSGGNLVIGTTTPTKQVRIISGGNSASNIVATFSSAGISLIGTVTANGIISNSAIAFNAVGAADSAIALGMPNNGAIRSSRNGADTVYFDVSTGGATAGEFKFRGTNSFTTYAQIGSYGIQAKTPYITKTSWNAAIDSEITVGNYRFRISNQGGIFPQIISDISGTSINTGWTAYGMCNGDSIKYTGNTGVNVANNAWTTLYNLHGMDAAADTVIVTLQQKTAGIIYRVTFMRSDNGSGTTGYNIIAEQLL